MADRLLVRGLVGTPSAILVEDGLIAALGDEALAADGVPALDGGGLSAHPGFIDLQVNGVEGLDFTSDPDTIGRAGAALARHGVTTFLPTIISSPRGTVETAIASWRAAVDEATEGAVPIGLHLEGPFLSAARAGAHDAGCLRSPDLDDIAGWTTAGVRMITLAPELPGGLEAVALIARSGTVAAIGHTDADAATTTRAIDAGARYATHLFNAMPPLDRRAPGAVGALLADERMTVGLIADGEHVDRLVLGIAARAMRGRLSIVSDSVGGALGGRPLEGGPHARLPDGTIAGGTAGLDHGVRVMAELIGPDAAIEAVTAVPARLLGLDDGRGFIRLGGRADLVLLTGRLEVAATIIGGRAVLP
jgi:N-acetylglucosamine-6-phosphate deacetylase